MSILLPEELGQLLGLPAHVHPVAYLCLGYVSGFPERPELEAAGWLPRLPLEELVFCERWGNECQRSWPALHETIVSHGRGASR